MESVNAIIERSHVSEYTEDLEGGWHTEGSLALQPGWNEFPTQLFNACVIRLIGRFAF